MSTESIGVLDQEESIAELLAAAERELSAFVIAVNQVFDGDQALKAANNWIEELERTDWLSEASVVDWRKVTIAAAAKFVWGRDSEFSEGQEQDLPHHQLTTVVVPLTQLSEESDLGSGEFK